jgi:hypothetical protein
MHPIGDKISNTVSVSICLSNIKICRTEFSRGKEGNAKEHRIKN